MKVGSVFAGYGGLDLAVHDVWPDAELAWVSENGAAPAAILAARFPDVPNHGDITKIDWSQVEPVDVLTGGSPCQDVSHAGKRAGMKDGTRSGLWAAMCTAIETLQPRVVIWENVKGALSARADAGDVESCEFCVGENRRGPDLRALGRVLGDLAECGYDAGWTCLRASDVGACHLRERVFVVAWRRDQAVPHPGRSGRPEGVEHDGRAAAQGHGRAVPDQRGRDADGPGPVGAPGLTLLPTPTVNDMGDGKTVAWWEEWTAKMRSAHGNGNGHGRSLAIEAQRLLPTPIRPADKASHRGSSLTDAVVRQPERWGEYEVAIRRWEYVSCRFVPHPLEDGPKGSPVLSPRFVEWMMGLPAGWVTGPDITITRPTKKPGVNKTNPLSRRQQLAALGNGVVPQQAAAAIRIVLANAHAYAGRAPAA